MKTTFSLIAERCGLSHREAAEFLGVRIDTVKSWSSGRNAAPTGAITQLRDLYNKIDRAAGEVIRHIAAVTAEHGAPEEIELGLASDDYEARHPPLGWPCVGAHAAMLGLVAARVNLPVRIAPRGSSGASAAAADKHDIST
ncbi:MAG: hypothetical protein LCH38_05325 [Proteobacteria bacterium]|nr:hypothetical protein [Pseudomonadota bacterium]